MHCNVLAGHKIPSHPQRWFFPFRLWHPLPMDNLLWWSEWKCGFVESLSHESETIWTILTALLGWTASNLLMFSKEKGVAPDWKSLEVFVLTWTETCVNWIWGSLKCLNALLWCHALSFWRALASINANLTFISLTRVPKYEHRQGNPNRVAWDSGAYWQCLAMYGQIGKMTWNQGLLSWLVAQQGQYI